jgi:hypothetical protein
LNRPLLKASLFFFFKALHIIGTLARLTLTDPMASNPLLPTPATGASSQFLSSNFSKTLAQYFFSLISLKR